MSGECVSASKYSRWEYIYIYEILYYIVYCIKYMMKSIIKIYIIILYGYTPSVPRGLYDSKFFVWRKVRTKLLHTDFVGVAVHVVGVLRFVLR